MVESSRRAKVNFIKMNQQELSSKIALLVSNNDRVIFWKTSPRYYEGRATHFEIGPRIKLTLSRCNIHLKLADEIICLNFAINDIDYFFRAKVTDQMDQLETITFELEESCFRMEKRSRDRLITYPIYEVYAYLKYSKVPQSNVVFFNKNEQKHHNFFTEIDNLQKNRLASLAQGNFEEDSEDLLGFRVEDISSTGLSFFANQKEKELILDKLSSKSFNLVLNFEMQVFNLQNASIVYMINYINAQFSGVPMFKVGITFEAHPDLKNKIEGLTGNTLELADYQKEFEEFIKNEH